ncbi:GntP family permease [Alteromonas confluentis]|uniref:Permease n=1 Tax=Alteromonas confluentis TaxID=1656094 RepID=A0A1E7Z9T1_9ALTE|nr:GntP family permease [Alteromonas confluentis]OFC70286.1 permease [Alteromonas confluentis]
MDATMVSNPTHLLLTGLGAVILLVILIIRLRVHAFVALILVSVLTAAIAGIASEDIVPVMIGGFGGTLASVALLVGLGCMIGKLLEVTGGAQVLADGLINRFGENRAPFAIGVASLLFGFPIFFDAGLIVMFPILLSVAARFGGSTIKYAFPAAGAFAVMHAFVPPHPGPVAAADLLGANIGLLLFTGLVIAIPTWYLGAYLFALYAGEKTVLPLPEMFKNINSQADGSFHSAPPSFATVLLVLLTPVLLIFMDTGLNTLQVSGVINGDQTWVHILRTLGKTPIALLITLLLCLALFTKSLGKENVEKLCGDSLAPICGVILVTGAGGMFGGVLRSSGIGEALAGLLQDTGLPVIVAAFVISTCLRVAQGSATVALTTTAALMAPIVAATPGLSDADYCFIVIAIAGGATVLSHFNDSGFWLVSRLLDMDEKTTLKTWTVMETLLGSIAFIIAGLLSIVF